MIDVSIINVIDLEVVRSKVRESKYESTVDFLNDIKWICHNIIVTNGSGNVTRVAFDLRNR